MTSCIKTTGTECASQVQTFIDLLKARKDIDQFMTCYSRDVILEDIIHGDRVVGKAALKKFLDWNNPNFQSLQPKNIEVYQIIVNKNNASISGHYCAFKWGNVELEPMLFTTLLYFNKAGLIEKQVDWINYPSSLLDYSNKKNANEWIQ